jgi:hypothetical protein
MHFSWSHPCYMTCPHHLCWIYHSNTQYAKLLQYLQPSTKMWPRELWKLTQSCHKTFEFSGLVNRGMKTNIFSLVQTRIKRSPWFLFEQEIFLQLSLYYNSWLLTMEIPHCQPPTAIAHLQLKTTGPRYIASARLHRKHLFKQLLYCCMSISCCGNVSIASLPQTTAQKTPCPLLLRQYLMSRIRDHRATS